MKCVKTESLKRGGKVSTSDAAHLCQKEFEGLQVSVLNGSLKFPKVKAREFALSNAINRGEHSNLA